MIDDLHGSILFNPKLSNDDVMNSAINIRPRISLVPLWKFYCDLTSWLNLDWLSPKFEFWIDRAVEWKARGVSMKCWNWWVVRNLFAQATELWSLNLISFSQKWIEGLAEAVPVACCRRNSKRSDVLHSIGRIWLLGRNSQKVWVLKQNSVEKRQLKLYFIIKQMFLLMNLPPCTQPFVVKNLTAR